MSQIIDSAVEQLNAKLPDGIETCVKFVVEDEGTIVVDETGARATDTPAEATLRADADTFRQILDGELDPTAAFMQGRLKVEGDMSAAMKLGAALS
jgi:putative sterol carrier protein